MSTSYLNLFEDRQRHGNMKTMAELLTAPTIARSYCADEWMTDKLTTDIGSMSKTIEEIKEKIRLLEEKQTPKLVTAKYKTIDQFEDVPDPRLKKK